MHHISYSQLSLALACPLLYSEMYAKGRKAELSPETKAMARGTKEHKLYEQVLKGEISKDQGALRAINPSAFSRVFSVLSGAGTPLLSEGELKIPYTDKYGLIIVADVLSEGYQTAQEVFIADFKSGRFRETFFEQLDFYAYVLMTAFPRIKKVRQHILGIGEFYHPDERIYTRKKFKEMKAEIEYKLGYVIALLEGKASASPMRNFRCADCLLSTCENYVGRR